MVVFSDPWVCDLGHTTRDRPVSGGRLDPLPAGWKEGKRARLRPSPQTADQLSESAAAVIQSATCQITKQLVCCREGPGRYVDIHDLLHFVLRLVSQLGETRRERIRDDMSWATPLDSPVVEERTI